jgi:hypothetical protein
MDRVQTRNDLTAAVPKFCLALEAYRRTPDGRVRTQQEFVLHFFPHDAGSCTDRIFKYVPNDVRGPILASWGIRGAKAALRDTDEKVQSVVHDALVAGDIDHVAFEDGLNSEIVVRWAPLAEWWTFWRGGKLTKGAIQKALATAYELLLFDAKWFLDSIESRGGKLRGTDVLSDGLTKDDLAEWVKKIHESGDGTPKGLLNAIGWDRVVARTANEVLVAVLDAMALKAGLAKGAEGKGGEAKGQEAKPAEGKPAEAKPEKAPEKAAEPAPALAMGPKSPLATTMSEQATPAVAAVRKLTEPPADMDWSSPESKDASVENETTVSQKGEPGRPSRPPASAGGVDDDSMIVVVDDEMDMGTEPGQGTHDPPTARKLEAAKPHEEVAADPFKSPKRSERPPASPPRNQRTTR